MHVFLFAGGGLFLSIVAWQLAVWAGEIAQKNKKYESAVKCCGKLGKPLLVAGGPWGNQGIRQKLNMPAHGAGDVCLDIDRRAFNGHPRGLLADVTSIPFADKTFGAAFASNLLEHLPSVKSANKALRELNRVSEKVFLVNPSRQSVGAWLHRGHHLWVWQKGNVVYLKQRSNSRGETTGHVALYVLSGAPR